ncbi:hypothetical protein L6R49_25865 [Myxococcota bacterium]|nr:hypothetical protein [Myxococcota bacterium]
MPKTFAEALNLEDRSRTSLSLNAKADWAIYSDYAEVLPKLTQALKRGGKAPKLMVFGTFGMGKTHTLRHTAQVLIQELPVRLTPLFIDIESVSARTTFLDIYRLIFAQLEGTLLKDLIEGPDWTRLNWERFELPPVVHEAVKELQRALKLSIAPDPQKVAQLRAWFSGQGLTLSATLKLGLSARLIDYGSPSVLVSLLRAFSQYARACDRPGYMLFIDEGSTRSISRDSVQALNALSEGFRSLADPSNDDMGVMFAVHTIPGRPPLLRNDVMQRLQGETIELPPMRTPAQVARFIKGLNVAMARQPWFEEDALALFAEGALRTGASHETPGQLTPRDLFRLLQLVGERIGLTDLQLPLNAAQVRPMFPSSGRVA